MLADEEVCMSGKWIFRDVNTKEFFHPVFHRPEKPKEAICHLKSWLPQGDGRAFHRERPTLADTLKKDRSDPALIVEMMPISLFFQADARTPNPILQNPCRFAIMLFPRKTDHHSSRFWSASTFVSGVRAYWDALSKSSQEELGPSPSSKYRHTRSETASASGCCSRKDRQCPMSADRLSGKFCAPHGVTCNSRKSARMADSRGSSWLCMGCYGFADHGHGEMRNLFYRV